MKSVIVILVRLFILYRAFNLLIMFCDFIRVFFFVVFYFYFEMEFIDNIRG